MDRKEALLLLKEHVNEANLIKHSLAVEAAMEALAFYFGLPENEKEEWAISGLLHDVDYELTKNEPEKHSLVGAKMLEELGLSPAIVQAVKCHNHHHQIEPQTLMAKALLSVDPLTGLIVAATLVLPSKKIADLTVQNVLNRFKEKRFAQGADRDIISLAEKNLGLSLEKFVEIVLKAMQSISDELGL